MNPVPNFPGYAVDKNGDVYSFYNLGNNKIVDTVQRKLKPGIRPDGSLNVILRNNDRGEVTKLVHHVVLESFVGPKPLGEECSHIDGNPQNNALSNLMWETHRENENRKYIHKTHPKFGNHAGYKISPEVALEIKQMLVDGVWQKAIAKKFNVSPGAISLIDTGKTHADVVWPVGKVGRPERPNTRLIVR